MAPSQLAQLKAALQSTGLNRKSQSKKSKKGGGKKGGAQDVDRAKKIAKLDDIHRKFNKFDERETRVRSDCLWAEADDRLSTMSVDVT